MNMKTLPGVQFIGMMKIFGANLFLDVLYMNDHTSRGCSAVG